ncbi:MAG: SIR2 family protein [Planctomycetes bacterium]|nr:SIR2 family protein [Planctomycetota bacterium]
MNSVKPSPADEAAWSRFQDSLSKTNDLEKSLQETTLPPSIIRTIVHETRACVLADDLTTFLHVISDPHTLALSRLFRHLFNSTHVKISVVTTNYDRLVEYAADAAGFPHETGFSNGFYRSFTPDAIINRASTRNRTIYVWKVHGSVDWYVDSGSIAVALPFQQEYPTSLTPLLVTPGITKYEQTHQEPFRTVISQADAALETARAYLCIGYGFNDIHIHPKLVQRVRISDAPIVILAHTLTANARSFLSECRTSEYLALEKHESGTTAYFRDEPDGVHLSGLSLWDFPEFLNSALGSE